MKTTLLMLLAILGVSLAAPQDYRTAYIVRFIDDKDPSGGYNFDFETSDGFRHNQEGRVKDAGPNNQILVVRGSYSYIGPDGVTYRVDYVADENGFQPEGDHLPGRKLGLPPNLEATLVGRGLG